MGHYSIWIFSNLNSHGNVFGLNREILETFINTTVKSCRTPPLLKIGCLFIADYVVGGCIFKVKIREVA